MVRQPKPQVAQRLTRRSRPHHVDACRGQDGRAGADGSMALRQIDGRAMLAKRLHWSVMEGDDRHSPQNVTKMTRGQALDDDDWMPSLVDISKAIDAWRHAGRDGIHTCSALRRRYRDVVGSRNNVRQVYLKGEQALLRARLAKRMVHFMSAKPVGQPIGSARGAQRRRFSNRYRYPQGAGYTGQRNHPRDKWPKNLACGRTFAARARPVARQGPNGHS